MKLAEALQERADLNSKIQQLKYRLRSNVVMQEGVAPVEDPDILINELNNAVNRLELLIAAINTVNCNTLVDGKSVTVLLARRDALNLKIGAYRDIIENASNITNRSYSTDIRTLSTVDVRKLQKELDIYCKELREIDNKIQYTNWTTEINLV